MGRESGLENRLSFPGLTLQPFNALTHAMRSSTASTTNLLICFTWLASLPIASAQTATSKLNPNEPLEKYNMPPAYIYRLETSPRMVAPYGGFICYHVKVDSQGDNILDYDAH